MAQLEYWDQYIDWGLDRARHPLLLRALDWLRANQGENEPTDLAGERGHAIPPEPSLPPPRER